MDKVSTFSQNTSGRASTEKAMAPHSSTLAWKIPWTEEPGRLQSMGSLRVRHDWATWLSLFTLMHWRRKWQPTPVFWRIPGTGELGGLPSVGSHRVGHDWSDLAAAAAAAVEPQSQDIWKGFLLPTKEPWISDILGVRHPEQLFVTIVWIVL